jgi:hypothetical protein
VVTFRPSRVLKAKVQGAPTQPRDKAKSKAQAQAEAQPQAQEQPSAPDRSGGDDPVIRRGYF